MQLCMVEVTSHGRRFTVCRRFGLISLQPRWRWIVDQFAARHYADACSIRIAKSDDFYLVAPFPTLRHTLDSLTDTAICRNKSRVPRGIARHLRRYTRSNLAVSFFVIQSDMREASE